MKLLYFHECWRECVRACACLHVHVCVFVCAHVHVQDMFWQMYAKVSICLNSAIIQLKFVAHFCSPYI